MIGKDVARTISGTRLIWSRLIRLGFDRSAVNLKRAGAVLPLQASIEVP